jgi:uncharacterized protein (DUF427 family)
VAELRAHWNGKVIADSDGTIELAGYRYFPRDAVRMDLLRISPRTASDLRCPHGVQFYDLVDDEHRSERAAWSYEGPRPAYGAVDHWIGFWEDVELVG